MIAATAVIVKIIMVTVKSAIWVNSLRLYVFY
jgi:hypothetical protein